MEGQGAFSRRGNNQHKIRVFLVRCRLLYDSSLIMDARVSHIFGGRKKNSRNICDGIIQLCVRPII